MKKTILALALAAGIASFAGNAKAQTFTPIAHPSAPSWGTQLNGIDGSNIIGTYANNGFIYNGTSYLDIIHPNSAMWTTPLGISGNNIVGTYFNTGWHSFLFNTSTETYIDIVDPSPYQHNTFLTAIYGSNALGIINNAGNYSNFIYNINTSNFSYINYASSFLKLTGISENYIIGHFSNNGVYGNSTSQGGLIYNIQTSQWTTINCPFAVDISVQSTGTEPLAISGSNIVGIYGIGNGQVRSFLYNITSQTWSSFNGTVSGISGDTIVGTYGGNGDPYYGYSVPISGISTIPTTQSVPEPSTYALFGLGASALIIAYRRRTA
jgi:hypothetical protein